MEIFRKVSVHIQPLEIEAFKESLPILGLEMTKNKTREIKCRLRELKAVLEYPNSSMALPIEIENIINEAE